MMTRGMPPVGYVVSVFPCWSETFIVREIQALRARGVPIRIFSLKPPRETLVQAEARPLLTEVIYPRPGRLMLALLRRPAAWLGAAWEACREAAPRGAREVVKALYTVAIAADFAEMARRLGVRHLHAHFASCLGLAVRTVRRLTGLSCSLTTHAHDIFLPNPYLVANAHASHTVVTISARYDLVVCSEVLEHPDDAALGARNLYRVLKPGGVAIVSMPNMASALGALQTLYRKSDVRSLLGKPPLDLHRIQHSRWWFGNILRLLRSAGFTIDLISSIFHVPFLWLVDDRLGESSSICARVDDILGRIPLLSRFGFDLIVTASKK